MKRIIISTITILCVFTLLITTNVITNQIYKNNNLHFFKLSMLCLGDSITYGIDGMNYCIMNKPYPELVKKELNLKNVYNYGISGSTLCDGPNSTAPMSTRCYDIVEDVDIITLMGGINDFSRNLPLGTIGDMSNTTIYGALQTIADCFKTRFPDAFVVFISPFPCRFSSEYNAAGYSQDDLCNAVKNVAEINGFAFLDLHHYGQYELEMNHSNSDGLHPSQEFMKAYTAPKIAQFIKANYKK